MHRLILIYETFVPFSHENTFLIKNLKYCFLSRSLHLNLKELMKKNVCIHAQAEVWEC